MTKTATQRQKEHIARLRRKAQAYDLLIVELQVLPHFLENDNGALTHINRFIARAESHVQEPQK